MYAESLPPTTEAEYVNVPLVSKLSKIAIAKTSTKTTTDKCSPAKSQRSSRDPYGQEWFIATHGPQATERFAAMINQSMQATKQAAIATPAVVEPQPLAPKFYEQPIVTTVNHEDDGAVPINQAYDTNEFQGFAEPAQEEDEHAKHQSEPIDAAAVPVDVKPEHETVTEFAPAVEVNETIDQPQAPIIEAKTVVEPTCCEKKIPTTKARDAEVEASMARRDVTMHLDARIREALLDFRYRCVHQHSEGGCPLAHTCVNSHAGSLVPMPKAVCRQYKFDERCMRKDCPFFHGTQEDLIDLIETGATEYDPAAHLLPSDWMEKQKELSTRQVRVEAYGSHCVRNIAQEHRMHFTTVFAWQHVAAQQPTGNFVSSCHTEFYGQDQEYYSQQYYQSYPQQYVNSFNSSSWNPPYPQ